MQRNNLTAVGAMQPQDLDWTKDLNAVQVYQKGPDVYVVKLGTSKETVDGATLRRLQEAIAYNLERKEK